MPSTTRKVGARVVLDGEEDYKKAIQSLNAGTKTLASEMKLLQAQYQDNTDSVEFLTAKSELLGRQLDQQKAKTELIRGMLETASEAYANALERVAEAENEGAEALAAAQEAARQYDLKVQQYSQALNNAQAEEINLQYAIDETNDALNGEGETMEGLGETVQSLADKFGITLPDSLTDALDNMGSFSSGTVAYMAAAAAGIAAVVTACKELMDMTLEAASRVDEMLTESVKMSIDTELYQQLDYMSELVDVSMDTMASSISKLNLSMASARDGNEELQKSFAALGVEIEDGNGQFRDSFDVFLDCIDALGKVNNETEAAALANDLFGKSYSDLKPLMAAGSDTMAQFAAQAKETGYVLDEYQIEKLAEVDDTYQILQNTITAFKNQLSADFAPAAVSAMELFQKAVETASDILEKSGIVENLSTILSCLFDIAADVLDLTANIPGLDSVLQGLKVTIGAIAQFLSLIADVADVITGIFTADWNKVGTALGLNKDSGQASHWQTTYMQQNGEYEAYSEFYANQRGETTSSQYGGFDTATGLYYDKNGNYIYPSYNAGGTGSWRGGLTWVGEAGPELVSLPAGSQIMSSQDSRGVGGDVFNITIDAKSVQEFNDIVRLAQSARVRDRMR